MRVSIAELDEDGALGRDRDAADLAVVDRVGRRGLEGEAGHGLRGDGRRDRDSDAVEAEARDVDDHEPARAVRAEDRAVFDGGVEARDVRGGGQDGDGAQADVLVVAYQMRR